MIIIINIYFITYGKYFIKKYITYTYKKYTYKKYITHTQYIYTYKYI